MSLMLTMLNRQLSDLSAGQRFWFWISAASPTPLLLTPVSDDPQMALLQTYVRLSGVKPLQAVFGIGNVRQDGRLSLIGAGLDAAHFDALVSFVADNIDAHADLGRLCGAQLHDTDKEMTITQTFADDARWPAASVPVDGTIAANVAKIHAMPVGSRSWLWMARSGPSGAPFFAVADSPEGLNAEIRTAISRAGKSSPHTVRAILTRTADGYTLSGQGRLAKFARMLASHHPELPPLEVGPLPQIGDDLSEQARLLEGLEPGESSLFWFSSSGDRAVLIVAETSEALRSAAKASPLAGGEAVRGRLRMRNAGWIEFATRKPAPELLPALASWASAHHNDWPALRRLRGARHTVRDAQDVVVDRSHQPALWAALR